MKLSPFAPDTIPELPALEGVRLGAAEAGIRYRGRKDLFLAAMPEGTQVGGVLTRSRTASAPVEWCRARLVEGRARALVVNSGNANAFTGMRGQDAVEQTARLAAKAVGCTPEEVLIASTGVIGEPLDVSKFADALVALSAGLRDDAWQDAARAIMTTDTFPKLATRTAEIDGVPLTLNGIAKGSGMIAPDMATMLAFFFTDAAIAGPALTSLCREAADKSFNCITVDGDTSTSDTVLLFATGTAAARGAPKVAEESDPRLTGFRAALREIMRDLALQIVKDGEGLTKFVTIRIVGAENGQAARRIAFSIANSPLVKTALAGEDPNWGRIVMAVGKAGEAADRDRLGIWFGDIAVAKDGMVHPDYEETQGAAYMKRAEIEIKVDAGTGGPGKATVWTTDLTSDYIAINAHYRS